MGKLAFKYFHKMKEKLHNNMPILTGFHLRHMCGNCFIPLCKTPLICIWARFPFDDKWFLWCKPSFQLKRILQLSNVSMKIGKSAICDGFSWSVATSLNSARGQVTLVGSPDTLDESKVCSLILPDMWNLSLAIRGQTCEVHVGQLLCTVGLSNPSRYWIPVSD